MWQVLLSDTSFWTCFWFLFAATLNMSVGPWKVVSIAYVYTSFEFIIASAMHEIPDPVLTLFAYKVAVLLGIIFGSAIQPKGNPWLIISLLPGILLYFHRETMYGVAAIYVVSCLVCRYYTWSLYCGCICLTCILLPMNIGGAPLIGVTAPVVFGFMYAGVEPAPFLPE